MTSTRVDAPLESPDDLFPNFRRWVSATGLLSRIKGDLSAKLPRILGQGSTRADGLTAPPAAIERKLEYISLKTRDLDMPLDVLKELSGIEAEIAQLRSEMLREEGQRRLAAEVLRELPQPNGYRDQSYFAGRLILIPDKAGFEWSWSVTKYYPLVKKLPPDPHYIKLGFAAAQQHIEDVAVPAAQFEHRLKLAWTLANHFSSTEDVLVTDVMRMFTIASQPDKFWQSPRRQNFVDLPDATFIISFMNWRTTGSKSLEFDFVPSTLHQAQKGKVFYLPTNSEGTEVRPMIYLRRRPQA